MTAMALLGGLSGGTGGQKFGGDAGPSRSGSAYSGGGSVGGLQFNTGTQADPANYTIPALILVAGIIAFAVINR